MCDEIRLNDKLPLLNINNMLEQANKMESEDRYVDEGDGIVVLVMYRRDVEFNNEETSILDCDMVKIKSNPTILALSTMESNGTIRCARKPWNYFSDRVKQKVSLALKTIIGTAIGIWPFKCVWALTTPYGWRTETDIEFKE